MEDKEKEVVVDDKEPKIDDDEDITEEDLEDDNAEPDGNTKKQTREENKKYAELRRQHEAEQKRVKELEEQNKLLNEKLIKTTKDSVTESELEELGLDKVETEDEMFLVEEYRKAKNNGSVNPAVNAYRKLRQRDTETQKKVEEQANKAKQDEIIAKDVEECQAQFKKNPTEIMKEQDFMDLFGEAIKYGNIASLYKRYLGIKEAEAEVKKAQKVKGSTPNASNAYGEDKTYTKLSYDEKIAYLKEQGYI